MGAHIVNGEFQSDKFPWCHRGFVPLNITDPMAWDLLWEYASRRFWMDPEFAGDLRAALRKAAYDPDHLNPCHAEQDGDCFWRECPQLKDGEPNKSNRHCPLDTEEQYAD